MHVCMQAQGHMLRPDSVLGVFLSQPSPYILGFLTDPEAHQFVKDGRMPQGPSYLYLLSTGITAVHHHAQFCLCVCVCGGVRGHLLGVGSFLSLCESWGLNSGC